MLEATWEFITSYGPALMIALVVWPLPYLNQPANGVDLNPPSIKHENHKKTCGDCP